MEHWWNNNDMGKLQFWGINVS